MYVWTEGNAVCKNLRTGHQANMYLHPPGKFRSKEYKIDGKVLDPENKIMYQVKGAWNNSIGYKKPDEDEFKTIVKFKERPENW
jgi:hypothetical protein